MKLPRHWAKGRFETTDAAGAPRAFECWGWSDTSADEARERGRARAQACATKVLAGEPPERYLYGERPAREEILEEFSDGHGGLRAAITRNALGCRVLNTSAAMFVDVDLPRPGGWERLWYRLGRLLGASRESPEQRREGEALERLRSMLADDAHAGARVYRTRAGLRYLITSSTADPCADTTVRFMEALGADPLYVRLCRVQECFRARLTPKPWRCGLPAPGERYPWPDGAAEARFEEWQRRYASACEDHATCRFVEQLGNREVHPEIAPLVALHDRLTRVSADLRLA